MNVASHMSLKKPVMRFNHSEVVVFWSLFYFEAHFYVHFFLNCCLGHVKLLGYGSVNKGNIRQMVSVQVNTLLPAPDGHMLVFARVFSLLLTRLS